jgi:hypothetical protein
MVAKMNIQSAGWKVIVGVVCTIGMVNLTISAEPTTSRNQKMASYLNEEFGVSFPVPKGLDMYTSDSPGPLASLFTPGYFIYLVNPNFHDENIGAKYSTGVTEDDLKQFKELLDTNPPTASLPGYKKISVKFIKIGSNGNKLAVEHIYNVMGNVLGKLRQVMFLHNGRAFTFTCASAQDRYYQANKELFDQVFSNMEFR